MCRFHAEMLALEKCEIGELKVVRFFGSEIEYRCTTKHISQNNYLKDMITKTGMSVTIDKKILARTKEIADLIPLSRYVQRLLELEIERVDSNK